MAPQSAQIPAPNASVDSKNVGDGPLVQDRKELAARTIAFQQTKGIPSTGLNVMDGAVLEEVAGFPEGAYAKEPERVYLAFQKTIGACKIDQFIPRNPLTMSRKGYESSTPRKATTGANSIVLNGMEIDSPEAVAEHLEQHVFPKLEATRDATDPNDDEAVEKLIENERNTQAVFGEDILKVPYGGGFNGFPRFRYGAYGYENYFMAYALFPELMEKDFRLQADLAVKQNTIAAKAYLRGDLPRLLRLDHDMAGTQGPLVNVKTLDRIWFPHFARAIQPYLDADVCLIWHCDGNLMPMVPRLLEVGLRGFQGFQYELGMDYEKICRMTDREGRSLHIQAGVSVTTTLPHGTTSDVKKELAWLVEHGPRTGLFLGASSSVTPATNADNIKTLIEGLRFYRENGRG